MTEVSGGALGLLIILAGFGSPALFVIMLRKTIAGFRTGEILYKCKLDRKSDAAFDYWASMLVYCVSTLATGAIALLFFSLSLVLVGQMVAR